MNWELIIFGITIGIVILNLLTILTMFGRTTLSLPPFIAHKWLKGFHPTHWWVFYPSFFYQIFWWVSYFGIIN